MTDSSSQNDVNTPLKRRRRFSRSVFVLPSLFTVGNIFCGYYAILATTHGDYNQAAYSIGIAIILDMLDGRIARLTNASTGFGTYCPASAILTFPEFKKLCPNV